MYKGGASEVRKGGLVVLSCEVKYSGVVWCRYHLSSCAYGGGVGLSLFSLLLLSSSSLCLYLSFCDGVVFLVINK